MPIPFRRSKESPHFTMSRFVRATRLHHDDWGVIDGASSTPVSWKVRPNNDQVHEIAGDSAVIQGGSSSLASLLAGRVLRDGEVVKLILKPSLWFIVYQSFLFVAIVVGCWFAYVNLGSPKPQSYRTTYGNIAVVFITGRLMLATLQWMGRYYLLTDQRVLRIAGVFNVDVKDCPLRKISLVQVGANAFERLARIGDIEIISKQTEASESSSAPTEVGLIWQTVPKPMEVLEKINDEIRRLQ